MTKQEIAFHIFLKRLPQEPLTDKTTAWFSNKAAEAGELAELFIKANPGVPPIAVIQGEPPEQTISFVAPQGDAS